MPGYSGTPPAKKLGIKDGWKIRLIAVPPEVAAELKLSAGLGDVKVCAVTDVWSGLEFVRRLKDR